MREEARSSTAVFVPHVDVNGGANDDGHEVDFFRRSSFGADTFAAYLFDRASGRVVRDEYSAGAGITSVLHSDLIAGGITGFSAVRMTPDASNAVVDAADVKPVAILYGRPEVSGGNSLVSVTVQTGGGTADPQTADIHLAAKAAPTSLAVVVPFGKPPTTSKVIKIPFVIVRLSPGKIPLPHGPFKQGNPSDDPKAGQDEAQTPAVAGLAMVLGDSNSLSWNDVFATKASLIDGIYFFSSPDGKRLSLVITCSSGACPRFVPLPISDPKDTPSGGVAFSAAP